MKIYTKTGDAGQTSLVGGQRVSKCCQRLESYGTVDELNSHIGVLMSELSDQQDVDMLLDVQRTLFVLGGYLATDTSQRDVRPGNVITPEMVAVLEAEIDRLQALIPADDSCCLLKMSAGVGFHSITGDWQFPDYTDTDYYKDGRNQGKKRYKSRKTAEWKGRLCLMGFVLLRTLDEGERDERVSALNATHADIKKGIMAAAQQREEEMAAKKRAEEDEARRREEEKARHAHIQQVMNDALHLQAEGRWAEAQNLLQTMEDDLPAEGKQQLEACRRCTGCRSAEV